MINKYKPILSYDGKKIIPWENTLGNNKSLSIRKCLLWLKPSNYGYLQLFANLWVVIIGANKVRKSLDFFVILADFIRIWSYNGSQSLILHIWARRRARNATLATNGYSFDRMVHIKSGQHWEHHFVLRCDTHTRTLEILLATLIKVNFLRQSEYDNWFKVRNWTVSKY